MFKEKNLTGKINAVVGLAGHWSSTMPRKPRKKGEGIQEWIGLIKLLDKFSQFANDYEQLLKKAPIANQRFTLNRGAEHLLQNFNVLSRASEQRRGSHSALSLHKFLKQAEIKLEEYCNRWQPSNGEYGLSYIILKTPVVYFEKLYGITRSIYAPEIPVISIPLTEYNTPDRWQALAHEIGHHIYWNSLDNLEEVEQLHINMYESIKNEIRPKDHSFDPWGNWLEEVFADVCGALFEGPRYLISCQEFAIEQTKKADDLAQNDNEHPSLYLRPRIVAQVIREISESINDEALQKALGDLDKRWDDFSQAADNLECKGTNKQLAYLAEEVPSLVHAILHAPMWPSEKPLWELIRFYGKDGLADKDKLELQDLQFPQLISPQYLPLQERQLIQSPDVITPPHDEIVPDGLKEVWNFLKKRVSVSDNLSDSEKALVNWNTLLELSLDEFHGHSIGHDYCTWHWYYWSNHKHNTGDTSGTVPCT